MTTKAPLYEQKRPKSLEEVVGQEHLTGKGSVIANLVAQKKALSFLLWGPPGTGKTTLARIYANSLNIPFFQISGAEGQIAHVKKLIKDIESQPLIYPHAILFVDEIHRINKSGQDLFLPYIEKGTITLIAATTENPSFTVNNALLSRMHVYETKLLDPKALLDLTNRTLPNTLLLTEDAKKMLVEIAQGDARFLMSNIEAISLQCSGEVTTKEIESLLHKKRAAYDKTGDGHYNLISALHKAIRASDTDASLYWFARMMTAGEDPKFLCRRLLRMASEDIGLADPDALPKTHAAVETFERLGNPEGELALAQIVIYLSLAPKSNSAYLAYKRALNLAQKYPNEEPPKYALNAPTKLMQKMDYGKGYVYDHDTEYGCSGLSYYPESFEERPKLYKPIDRGQERDLKKALSFYEKLRSQATT